MDQWLLPRGDIHKPVLLWLHGGPGAAQMPLAPVTAGLEDEWLVVHWDQRGAGLSHGRDFDPATMTFEQYLADAREVTAYLQERYGRERITLLGHSWGTQLGLHLVARWPEDYHMLISVGQVVHTRRSHEVAWQWVSREIAHAPPSRRTRSDRKTLASLGRPPFEVHQDYVTLAQLVNRYGGGMDWRFPRMARHALASRVYRWRDYRWWLAGASRGSGPMWSEYLEFDNFRDVPEVRVPVVFIQGERDRNTPLSLVQEYFEYLSAPPPSQLMVFPGAAHTPFLADPEHFCELVNRLTPGRSSNFSGI